MRQPLLELVNDVQDVVACDEQRCRDEQPLADHLNWGELVDAVNDGCLLGSQVAEGVGENELIILIAAESAAVDLCAQEQESGHSPTRLP